MSYIVCHSINAGSHSFNIAQAGYKCSYNIKKNTLFQQCSIEAKIKLLNLTTMLLYKSGHAIEQLLLQWFNKAPHSISSITDSSILAYLHKTIALHNKI